MGRQYEYDEWFQFLSGNDEVDEWLPVRKRWTTVCQERLDMYNETASLDLDPDQLAYYCAAVLCGYGLSWSDYGEDVKAFGEWLEGATNDDTGFQTALIAIEEALSLAQIEAEE